MPDDSVDKQRLYYGNFDYDDSPALLFTQNILDGMFNNPYIYDDKTHYITVDAARQGKDKTEIMVWEGLSVIEIITIDKSNLVDQAGDIESYMKKY